MTGRPKKGVYLRVWTEMIDKKDYLQLFYGPGYEALPLFLSLPCLACRAAYPSFWGGGGGGSVSFQHKSCQPQ